MIYIVMTTYNRWNYLAKSISSIAKHTKDFTIHIADDCSQSEIQHGLLKYLSDLGHDVVTRDENLGTYQNSKRAITHGFNKTDEDFLYYLQDDVEVCEDWYSIAAEKYKLACLEHDHVAYMSMYNRMDNLKYDNGYAQIHKGHTGGVGWVISRKWWAEYITSRRDGLEGFALNDKTRPDHKYHICDWKFTHAARELGYKIFALEESVVQHVGDKSSLTKNRDMSRFRTGNFRG